MSVLITLETIEQLKQEYLDAIEKVQRPKATRRDEAYVDQCRMAYQAAQREFAKQQKDEGAGQ